MDKEIKDTEIIQKKEKKEVKQDSKFKMNIVSAFALVSILLLFAEIGSNINNELIRQAEQEKLISQSK